MILAKGCHDMDILSWLLGSRCLLYTSFLFTMFFSGGLIPTFLTVKSLGLYNNPWVMVILGATSMTNIIICLLYTSRCV